jgi:hypothetical protein
VLGAADALKKNLKRQGNAPSGMRPLPVNSPKDSGRTKMKQPLLILNLWAFLEERKWLRRGGQLASISSNSLDEPSRVAQPSRLRVHAPSPVRVPFCDKHLLAAGTPPEPAGEDARATSHERRPFMGREQI